MRSGSHSWGTRPHLRPAESLFQQRSPPGIPRRPGPLLPRRGGEGQPGGAPTQKPMEAAPEARRRWAGGGGRPWPPPPGATVGGPTWNAPPSVPQVPVLRVLLSADLSCLQHFATLEEAGGSRQSHGGRAGTAQQAHSPQAQTRTWDRTPGDRRVTIYTGSGKNEAAEEGRCQDTRGLLDHGNESGIYLKSNGEPLKAYGRVWSMV